jgi:hypothetical protein
MQHTMKKLAGATFVAVMSLAGDGPCGRREDRLRRADDGRQAHYGKDMQNGIVLALEDFNATNPKIGGKPVKFVLETQDDQADPRTGTTVAQKLVDDGIKGMLGHFNSGTTIPASRIYANAGIPKSRWRRRRNTRSRVQDDLPHDDVRHAAGLGGGRLRGEGSRRRRSRSSTTARLTARVCRPVREGCEGGRRDDRRS